MKSLKTIIYASFVLSILLISCGKKEESKPTEAKQTVTSVKLDSLALKNIQTEELSVKDYEEYLTVVGEVSFDEDHVVRIYPIVSGSVEDIKFSLGDYIKKGQLMATILSTDISTYQRDFNIARANLDVALKNYERMKQLFESNFASEKDLQIAETEFKNAKADFTGKKQILELYGGSADKPDAVFNVYAPISGYLVERTVNQGTQIRTDNNTNMFTISDLKTVWIWANVYESDIARVHVGDTVSATTISYPDKEFSGRVQKINNVLEPESRVVKVRTEVPNEAELLKPEMFATIKIKPQTKIRALSVLTSGIFLEKNESYVIRRTAAGEFEKVKVTTGKVFNGHTEILSGLKEGDVVVHSGALLVANEINNKN